MVKRESISATDFVKVYVPMALANKSALEIGQALGLEDEPVKIAQFVSVKASQLRGRLADKAAKVAAVQGLDSEATEAFVKSATDKLPKIKSRGRKSGTDELVSMLDSILASVNGQTDAAVDAE
jgi:hypothetical protein